ncbi:MAG: hypothetical protein AB1782_06865 [Cyanobacteriota bacterium]
MLNIKLIYKIIVFKYKLFSKRFFNQPVKIIIGASGTKQKNWVSSDINLLNLLKPSLWKAYFKDCSIDALLAEHVWEHLSSEESIIAAKTCFYFLKRGGYIRIAVPDGLHPDNDYIEWVKPGGIGAGSEDHKVLYTYKTLKEIFESAGFKVNLLEYFDETKQFHFNDWQPEDGMIERSKRFDSRNIETPLKYTSIILDAIKT